VSESFLVIIITQNNCDNDTQLSTQVSLGTMCASRHTQATVQLP